MGPVALFPSSLLYVTFLLKLNQCISPCKIMYTHYTISASAEQEVKVNEKSQVQRYSVIYANLCNLCFSGSQLGSIQWKDSLPSPGIRFVE